ncbi:MAG: adenine nucleotide alpha hydrolase [Gammaproteobacteria bacterium]|nr:adenine nucleotide alpha hydrolase [Gammaproteobacteria bacterium]
MCFSGGKDSVMALQEIRRRGRYRVVALLTTVTDAYDRVSMHGVRRSLARTQAESLGLPVTEVVVPPQSSNAIYEKAMGEAFSSFRAQGIRRVAFGDIFLEDLRAYRERQLAASGLRGVFPLWKRSTASLARAFVERGFRAVTVCVDARVLGESFAGRPFDHAFLDALPESVDPCGENGEFHTFVSDGPGFAYAVDFRHGQTVHRDGFFFHDLVPPRRQRE